MKNSKAKKSIKLMCTLLLFVLVSSITSAQMNKYVCQDLRSRFTPLDASIISNSSWYHIDTKGRNQELNYVTPLRRFFLNKDTFYDVQNFQSITSFLSMTGAYQDVIRITKQHNDYLSKSEPSSNQDRVADTFSLIDFSTLLGDIDTFKVVMINEAHDRIQPRAYILSILPQLKLKGFTHLAMETLNYSNQKGISLHSGYYTSEPMFGEVAREALRLGFTLVPYEDTNAMMHTNPEREIAQATNLSNAVTAASMDSKFFVIAGYAHIAEEYPEGTFSTMAMQFNQISGINPFTIDQVTSLGDSNNFLFSDLSKNLTHPKVIVNVSEAISIGLAHYDAFVIHQPTKLNHCRPDWLACNGIKKNFSVKCNNKKTILVQAYYGNEITSNKSFQTRVPADQTFYLDANGFAHLFLIPENDYIIVFRDENNKIIQTQKGKV